MKIIIGLGNPGEKYEGTRHNAGFMFVDELVCAKEIAPVEGCLKFELNKKFDALIADTSFKGEKMIIAKPQTYMNLSGQSVRRLLDFYKADIADIIVVSDDVDLPLGSSRVRHDGSSGGQKGLQNIIDVLGSDIFTRIRIGIKYIGGSTAQTEDKNRYDTADFVLSKFDDREIDIVDSIIGDTIAYILPFIAKEEQIPAHTLEVKVDSL